MPRPLVGSIQTVPDSVTQPDGPQAGTIDAGHLPRGAVHLPCSQREGLVPGYCSSGCPLSHASRCPLLSRNLHWRRRGGRQVGAHETGSGPLTQAGLLISSVRTVRVPIAEPGRRQAAPVGTGQRVLGARAALFIRPVSTVILPIAEQGQGQAAAGTARHLPLPTARGGTAWGEEGRQAQDTHRGSQRSPQPQKPGHPCPQAAGNWTRSLGSGPRTCASIGGLTRHLPLPHTTQDTHPPRLSHRHSHPGCHRATRGVHSARSPGRGSLPPHSQARALHSGRRRPHKATDFPGTC